MSAQTTMYAIKKVGDTHPINEQASSNKQSSATSSATSVWQKKKRKRGTKKHKSNKSHEAIDDDSSSMTTNDDSLSQPQPGANDDQKKQRPPLTSSSSYDPAQNPYSLENYQRNHELQKTVENNVNKAVVVGVQLQPMDKLQAEVQAVNVTPSTVAAAVDSNTPLSQVRLTPLFPTPPAAALGNNGYNGFNKMPSLHMPTNAGIQRLKQHAPQYNTQAQQQQAQYDDPLQCPHGSLSAEELINIKIRKRNVCYVVGLPIHVATEQKLRTQEWFGQFGNIATIAINRNSKSIQANSIPAHITYDNDISALNAINFCNKFIFDDGRKLKATFGTQHYCRWFIAANKKCTNVFCGFRHSWCRVEDIITQKDINDFKAIPAGAYTSRNIENQPLGVRSASSDHQSFKSNSHSHSHDQDKYVTRTSHITPHDPVNIAPDTSILSVATGAPNAQPKISTDPYTFYLSNSAATPTGPGQPQAPPNIPNIYDSRNVLMKQIMNRNHAQQLEIERLQQQIKILSEMEMKNKQEIHRWWTDLASAQQNEKKLKTKYDKMSVDYDNLQIKYLALDEKYKHLLETKNAAQKKEFEAWSASDVVQWIMSLDEDKFHKYEAELTKNIATENIDGQCLESLDKGDLHRLGVTDFKDKKDLLQRIKELVTPAK
eukprot:137057_1